MGLASFELPCVLAHHHIQYDHKCVYVEEQNIRNEWDEAIHSRGKMLLKNDRWVKKQIAFFFFMIIFGVLMLGCARYKGLIASHALVVVLEMQLRPGVDLHILDSFLVYMSESALHFYKNGH